ncbi:RHS repeat-associated core domain-containing protein [Pseudomonas sp. TE50-2]|uniref:RHS repeat-associated core domain-containing protein n=1 Tax=Pseudomonas sp. TE50-2 TaxID=3142707 RepID=UPI0034655A9B
MFKKKLLASDHLLSTSLALDASGYALASYTPFGDRCALTGFARMGYSGQFRESGSGSYLLGNGRRAYNAQLMRFHSPDTLSPFGAGGLNPYAYCKGDPINMTDPSGNIPGYKATVAGNLPALYVAGREVVKMIKNRELPSTADAITALIAAPVAAVGMYSALLQYHGEPAGDDYANWTTGINGFGTFGYLFGKDMLKGGSYYLNKLQALAAPVANRVQQSFRTIHADEIAMAEMAQENEKVLSTFKTQHSVVDVRGSRPGSTSSDSDPEPSDHAAALRRVD